MPGAEVEGDAEHAHAVKIGEHEWNCLHEHGQDEDAGGSERVHVECRRTAHGLVAAHSAAHGLHIRPRRKRRRGGGTLSTPACRGGVASAKRAGRRGRLSQCRALVASGAQLHLPRHCVRAGSLSCGRSATRDRRNSLAGMGPRAGCARRQANVSLGFWRRGCPRLGAHRVARRVRRDAPCTPQLCRPPEQTVGGSARRQGHLEWNRFDAPRPGHDAAEASPVPLAPRLLIEALALVGGAGVGVEVVRRAEQPRHVVHGRRQPLDLCWIVETAAVSDAGQAGEHQEPRCAREADERRAVLVARLGRWEIQQVAVRRPRLAARPLRRRGLQCPRPATEEAEQLVKGVPEAGRSEALTDAGVEAPQQRVGLLHRDAEGSRRRGPRRQLSAPALNEEGHAPESAPVLQLQLEQGLVAERRVRARREAVEVSHPGHEGKHDQQVEDGVRAWHERATAVAAEGHAPSDGGVPLPHRARKLAAAQRVGRRVFAGEQPAQLAHVVDWPPEGRKLSGDLRRPTRADVGDGPVASHGRRGGPGPLERAAVAVKAGLRRRDHPRQSARPAIGVRQRQPRCMRLGRRVGAQQQHAGPLQGEEVVHEPRPHLGVAHGGGIRRAERHTVAFGEPAEHVQLVGVRRS